MQTSFRMEGEGAGNQCYRWSPEGVPHAVVVIAHGMGEHAGRYARLAEEFVRHGLETFALDHRGHGRTAAHEGELGVFGPAGWDGVVDDYARLVAQGRSLRPGVPVVVLGHSMGSFVVQQFLLDHAAEVDAAVLSGSAALDEVKVIVDTTTPLELSMLNAPFVPARTDFDWLSRDEAEVDAYLADPLCGFGVDPAGLASWFANSDRLADPTALTAIGEGFPIALVAGSADPVNAGFAWLEPLASRYADAGIRVTKLYYDGARHEVFNEVNRDEISADVIAWLDRALQRAPAPSRPPAG